MKIQKMLSQYRRDFQAVYVCEGCGATKKDYGYDDKYFHETVIPNMKCDKCGKTNKELAVEYTARATRYAEGDIV